MPGRPSDVLIPLLLALASGSASAERGPEQASLPGPEVVRTVQHYDVVGRTEAELVASIEQNGLRAGGSQTVAALTEWKVGWQYRYGGEQRCALDDIEVRVEIEVTLPRWKDRTGASAALVRNWDRYEAALGVHEDGHAQIGIEAAGVILERLLKLAPASSCQALRDAVDTEAAKVIDSFRTREVGYDLRTGHGVTQGTRFP